MHYSYIFLFFVLSFFSVNELYAQVEFIENKGQWDPRVKFMTHAGDGSFFLQEKGYTVTQYNPEDVKNLIDHKHGVSTSAGAKTQISENKVRSHAYSVEFLNATGGKIVPDKPVSTVNNYFIGNDKSKWASNCRIFRVVTYENLYPGIDVRYYVDGGSNLKYDFIVHPGANVDNIAMKYSGAEDVAIKSKELVISTPLGKSRALQPLTYQVIDNSRQEVDCRYIIKDNVVRFKVKNYDPSKTLIIDPTEIFFSYSGSTADNWGFTATYGPDGSFYGGGTVYGVGFPVSIGAADESFNGAFDIAIMKLTPDGRNRVYATYIGGSAEEQPHSLIVDQQGNLVLAGRSNSPNYPTTSTYGPGGDWDIIVTKLNATGSAIIGSMKIGGSNGDGVNIADENSARELSSLKRNYSDDARSEVILDGQDNIYLASCTQSSNFPTTAGAFQKSRAGLQDAVVLKLDPACNSVLFSTLIGGSMNDAAYVLALGNNNNIYVAGGSGSADLNGISASGVVKPDYSAPDVMKDDCDGFIIEMNNSGTNVLKGTFIGTGKADQVYGIEVDKFGYVYAMGTSEGDMPVINAAYSNAGAKQFISKLQPDLGAFVYSTVFGTPGASLPNISPTAFLVDRCENVYVSGWGGKSNNGFTNGNTIGMPTTPGAIKAKSDASGSDFYFFVLKKDAVQQLYGTFFGQEDPPLGVTSPMTFGDHVDGGTSRFDRNGVIYQAICANCYRTVAFPGTPGAWSTTNQAGADNGGMCNLGMLKIEMNFSGVRSSIRTTIDGVANDTTGCVPLRVDFSDTLNLGKLYYWDFGDGSGDTTTVSTNSHVYNNIGTYKVRLISIDSLTCNIADTSYKFIKVANNKVNLDFIAQKLAPCTNLSYDFTNTSTAGVPFTPNSFTWDFGDNTPLVTQGASPVVNHTYASEGTYQVKLSIVDSNFCNSPDDTIKTVRLSPEVKAAFVTPAAGCAPYDAVFTNNSLGGISFIWDFGDGTTSTEDNPTHLYANTGTYKITLQAFDSSSCNKVDSTSFTIKVSTVPTASFSYSPNPPTENAITKFVNQSIGATQYLWNFGDQDSSTEANPQHLFNASQTYNVCLKATNDEGCSDDTCMEVRAIVTPILDVPSAFTPGKFGMNGKITVEGFAIQTMHWDIYNRWGQKVYSSNNRKSGWDGTFKGKLQPADVYTYTLDVTFSDGTKVRKTGDITLIR